ncbi:MAG: GNAT family N-acetyltransferase [Cyclobacteriaceae bacterium]|nr:GNAT family N-acetyltransferase [Cyclobacteriaceae bacterium]
MNLLRTDSSHSDFIYLVAMLDAYLAISDGADHGFYAQFNKIDLIKNVVLAYEENHVLGCGAFKIYEGKTVEIKRMFCRPESRRKGVVGLILQNLEEWAKASSHEKCILETGKKQVEAIALYRKAGYGQIANYGQYSGIEASLCFEKHL